MRVMSRRSIALALLAAVALAVVAPPALADGDPASDVLIGEVAFFPYPRSQAAVWKQLYRYTTAANAAGYKIRVAVIATPSDLGAYPQLFGHPKPYVRLLGAELAFAYRNRLLVVMPQGVAGRRIRPTALARAARGVDLSGGSPEALGQAALTVVQRLATGAGYHPKATAQTGTTATAQTGTSATAQTTPGQGGSSVGVSAPVLLAAGGALLLAAAAVTLAWPRLRRRGGGEGAEESDG
jgi:hypothetical protein